MKKWGIKLTSSFMLVVLLFGVLQGSALATGCNADEYMPLTEEQVQQAKISNAQIDAYYTNRIMPRFSGGTILSVPLYQQETSFTCGVASARMVIKYATGTKYAESTLKSEMGVTSAGADSGQVARILNKYIGSGSYQLTTTSNSQLWQSLVYSIDRDYPMICSVKEMPEYTSGSGHFIVLTGYTYGGSGVSAVQHVAYNDCHYNSNYFESSTMTLNETTTAINSNAGKFIRYAK